LYGGNAKHGDPIFRSIIGGCCNLVMQKQHAKSLSFSSKLDFVSDGRVMPTVTHNADVTLL